LALPRTERRSRTNAEIKDMTENRRGGPTWPPFDWPRSVGRPHGGAPTYAGCRHRCWGDRPVAPTSTIGVPRRSNLFCRATTRARLLR
jgi:hypothetical protein